MTKKLGIFSVLLLCFACSQSTVKNDLPFFNHNLVSSPESPVSKIKISFVGDILIHSALYKSVVNSKSQNFSQLWQNAIPYFNSADYSYANLEGPTALGISNKLKDMGDIGFVYDGSVYSGEKFLFNFHPRIINDIKDSGIDIISTANNHTFDRGSVGIDRTIDALQERSLNFMGTRRFDEKNKEGIHGLYKITQVKDFKIGWVACSEFLNGFKDKHGQTLLCYEQIDEILQIIQELKQNEKADIVIVTPHWGIEYKIKQNSQQTAHAHKYLEAGADVVIGSHPHVLQPVEHYKTKDGRNTFIAYSLGNFVSGQLGLHKQASAIVFLEFQKNDKLSWISSYGFQPIFFNLKQRQLEIIHPNGPKDVIQHVESIMSLKKGN